MLFRGGRGEFHSVQVVVYHVLKVLVVVESFVGIQAAWTVFREGVLVGRVVCLGVDLLGERVVEFALVGDAYVVLFQVKQGSTCHTVSFLDNALSYIYLI